MAMKEELALSGWIVIWKLHSIFKTLYIQLQTSLCLGSLQLVDTFVIDVNTNTTKIIIISSKSHNA